MALSYASLLTHISNSLLKFRIWLPSYDKGLKGGNYIKDYFEV